MARRFMQLFVVSFAAMLLAGCLSINVDKTEHNSTNSTTPAKNGPDASHTGAAN